MDGCDASPSPVTYQTNSHQAFNYCTNNCKVDQDTREPIKLTTMLLVITGLVEDIAIEYTMVTR